jgi:uncharacterized protein
VNNTDLANILLVMIDERTSILYYAHRDRSPLLLGTFTKTCMGSFQSMMNKEDLPDQGRSPQAGSASLLANLVAGSEHLRKNGIRLTLPRVYRGLRFLLSLPGHLRVLRVLSHPQSARLVREHPLLAFKYWWRYVALRLPMKTRRSILLSHFQFLQRTFGTTFLDLVERLSPTLWSQTIEQKTFHVALELIRGCEGELRLAFSTMGSRVYQLIFVFASGRDFNLRDETIIIVSSIKGVHDFDRVKLATKICHDIQPAHILMAALGGLAEAANVSAILGLHQTRQLFRDKLSFSYEKFFETYGDEIPGEGMYYIRVPYFRKPASEIKPTHRGRNRRKREFKADVHDQTVRALRQYLG